MSRMFFLFVFLFGFSGLARAVDGYLVFTYDKVTFIDSKTTQEKITYKVRVDGSFLSQFKNPASQQSAGSLFYCLLSDGYEPLKDKGLVFHRWFSPWQKGKIGTWAFALGNQSVKEMKIYANSPGATASSWFSDWRAVDAAYMRSFLNGLDGVNIGYDVLFVEGNDPLLKSARLAPVLKSNGEPLVSGELQTGDLQIRCGFQEG